MFIHTLLPLACFTAFLKISAAARFTQPLASNFFESLASARFTSGLLPYAAARSRFAASFSLRP